MGGVIGILWEAAGASEGVDAVASAGHGRQGPKRTGGDARTRPFGHKFQRGELLGGPSFSLIVRSSDRSKTSLIGNCWVRLAG